MKNLIKDPMLSTEDYILSIEDILSKSEEIESIIFSQEDLESGKILQMPQTLDEVSLRREKLARAILKEIANEIKEPTPPKKILYYQTGLFQNQTIF